MIYSNIPALLSLATSALTAPATNLDVTFTLSDIKYSSFIVYAIPAHLATYGGDIEFNVTNSHPSYVTRCRAHGNHLEGMFYGEIDYTCEIPVVAPGYTIFSFDRPSNFLSVNQSWVEFGGSYLAIGRGNANLACKTTRWVNPNWTLGQVYSRTDVDCKPASLTITPTVFPSFEGV